MIVKISSGGKSFAGLSTYLTHDPNSATDERVAWTHTHNLANDHVPSAVDEMYQTARNAELLKQEAGIRAGGRATESPVKHVSLNWSPEDNPTREHMIETTERFLRHMKWQEHQAILVAHDDKTYKHVHVMLNVVHPETGLQLNDDFEQRRAQAWALAYEREQGRIYCEQRLNNVEDREKSMPRNIWMQFQKNEKEFQRDEQLLNNNQEFHVNAPENIRNSEWKILKEFQRDERKEFFAQGKIEFSNLRSSIYREVREEFRERWADYYRAEKNGTEADRRILSDVKNQLIADQKATLEPRRDAACLELRQSRDQRYRDLLDHQAETRAELRWRQDAGLDNAPFLNELATSRDTANELASGFHDAAHEVTTSERESQPDARETTFAGEGDNARIHSGRNVDINIGGKVGGFAGSLLDALFRDLTLEGNSNDPLPRSKSEVLQAAADETQRRQQYDLEDRDDTGQLRQKVLNRE
jgi:relaxase-like protein